MILNTYISPIRPTYFFVPGLPLAEKSQICSNVDMSTDLNLSCFPATKKLDRSADRQAADLVYRDTLICPSVCDGLKGKKLGVRK